MGRIAVISAVAALGLLLPAQLAMAEVMPLPVPVRTIYPNDELQDGDFATKEFIVNESIKRNYLLDTEGVGKSVALRVLPAGKPVMLRAIKRKADARKGQAAIARYAEGGIEIQGFLVPEQDGSAGEVIKVKNPQTGVTLLAKVKADGSLSVGGN